jgi:AcrR family transcriptional regulator
MKRESTSGQAQRRERTRGEILRVASRLFSDHGYENVTLRAIAQEIGYSHAAIYQHFPDKDHILSELCEQTFALLAGDIDRIAASCPDPRQRLFETSAGLVRFFLAHPQHVRVVFFGPANRNGVRIGEYIDNIGQPLFTRLSRVFAEAVDANRLNVGPGRLVIDAWWGAVLGLAVALTIQGGLPGFSPPDQVVTQLVTTMWSGIAVAGSTAPRSPARPERPPAGARPPRSGTA